VLDFGLAKALSNEPQSGDPAASPTLTMRETVAGVVLGTAAYMSPEQAKGKSLDRRADIWAFGVVFYEMLTGRSLYAGETVSDTLAAVLTRDPDWGTVPARFQPLLRRCLERDPTMRLRDIGEARVALEAPSTLEKPTPARSLGWWLLPAAGILVAALAALIATALSKPVHQEPPVRRFALSPRGLTSPDANNGSAFVSPDGKRIVYVAEGKLWVRDLDREEARALEGTEGAVGPFWSPDSEWLACRKGAALESKPAGRNPCICLLSTRQSVLWRWLEPRWQNSDLQHD
jgi:eukaryotic-like serine/threonine-protein kinase